MRPTTIVLADDHAILREGMKRVLESAPDFAVVGEAGNGREAVELVVRHRPDIAILDISMPEMTGIEAARALKAMNVESRIMILTVHDDEDYITQVLRTGVDGYILKNSSPEDIIEAVHSVAAGERYIGQGVSKSIVANFVRQVREEEYNPDSRPRRLTKREVEIVRCIAAGMTSKEISDALHVSIRTVQSHRLNIMQKLDIHEIAGLVMYAVKNGLVESG